VPVQSSLSWVILLTTTIYNIERQLIKSGYSEFKNKTRNRIAIVTDRDRSEVMQEVANLLQPLGAKYIEDYTTPKGARISSVGVVVVGNEPNLKVIYTKPKFNQSKRAPGSGNESNFINGINKYLDKSGYGYFHTITIKFVAKNNRKVLEVGDVLIAENVASDTMGRKKADVNLVRLNQPPFPISLKQDDSVFWESADTLLGKQAEIILSTLDGSGEIIYDKKQQKVFIGSDNNKYTGLSIPLSKEEKTDAVFGSDILGNGAIIKGTYPTALSEKFSFDEKLGVLTIKTSRIYETLNEINRSDEEPYLLIRKDVSRTAGINRNRKYSGLRVIASYKNRVTSGAVKILDRERFNLQ